MFICKNKSKFFVLAVFSKIAFSFLQHRRLSYSRHAVPFLTSHQFEVSFVSDLQKKYVVDASMTDTRVRAPKRNFKTKDLFVGFATSVDSTRAYMRAGDLDVNFEGRGYVETILQQVDAFTSRAGEQWTSKTIV